MNITGSALSIAVALVLIGTRAAAEETVGSSSPDGKWEFRSVPSKEEPDRQVFVITQRGSQEPAVALSEEAAGTFAESAKVVWAADSKRFAFNYQPGLRVKLVQVFQLEGEEWRELEAPGSADAINGPINRSMAAQRKKLKLSPKAMGRPISDTCEARRWLTPAFLLLYVDSNETFTIKDELEQVGQAAFVTLKFGSDGEWRLTRTRFLAEGAELTPEEKEEFARLQKEE